jgi:hypothetical protein
MAVMAGEGRDLERAARRNTERGVDRLAPVLLVVGAALIVLASFLTWLVSGSVDRSSYSVVRAAELLGVVHGPAATALKLWYLVPMVGAMVLLAAVSGARRVALGAGLVMVVLTIPTSMVVIASPLPTGRGPWVAVAGSAVVLIGSILTARDLRGARWTTT